jgi:hypothetical protein
MQPQYKTTVPGKQRIAEENENAQIFQRKSGDFKKEKDEFLNEELKIRRSGQKPSKEFME